MGAAQHHLVDAGIQDRGHRAVEDRCLRDRQLGGVGTQGLADEALLEGATLVGGCGQAGGAAGGHPVREGQDSGVVGGPAVARRRIAAEHDAHVLVDQFLESSRWLQPGVGEDIEQPAAEYRKVVGHGLGGQGDAQDLPAGADEGHPIRNGSRAMSRGRPVASAALAVAWPWPGGAVCARP